MKRLRFRRNQECEDKKRREGTETEGKKTETETEVLRSLRGNICIYINKYNYYYYYDAYYS